MPNIQIYFKHKVISADFDEKLITLRELDSNSEFSVTFDFCIGADGSYSIIRQQMMRVVRRVIFIWSPWLRNMMLIFIRMDYQQEYIKHEYIELKMRADQDGEGKPTFLLDPHHLHIWPRHSFMLIALPNKVT